MSPLTKYAQVILHSGCTIPPIGETKSRLHRWDECRDKNFYLRIAKRHQHKLKSNGLAIGVWIKREDLQQVKDHCDYLGILDNLLAPVSE